MVESRRGLGRGLSALLDEVEAPAEAGRAGVSELPLEAIKANPAQPRRRFDDADIEELAASIREKGVLQPILVRPAVFAGQYEIVAGERRWRAAALAGLRQMPALVRSLSDAEVLEIAIVENVQRVDLSPIEEAEGYRALIDRFGRTQAEVAQVVGKSRVHVANALRLLQLPEPVKAMVREGRLTAGPRAPADRHRPTPSGWRSRWPTRASPCARPRRSPARRPAAPRKRKDADTAALENDLSEVLGLQVEIRDAGGAGELRIRYASLEQLDDLCRRLTRG